MVADHFQHLFTRFGRIDHQLHLFRVGVADDALKQIQVAMDQRRGGLLNELALDTPPLLQQHF